MRINSSAVCHVGFDYGDPGLNDKNVSAMLKYFCLCNPDNKACQKLVNTNHASE